MDQLRQLGDSEDGIKQQIGEKIYVKVMNMGHNEDFASRITGILIDQGLQEISDMISSEASLNEKIAEANQLLVTQQ